MWQAPLLLGMNATVLEEDGKLRGYNSAILIDRAGHQLGRYDKIHRVPFGEYIPMRSLMPWLNHLAPYDYDYAVSPGKYFTRFVLPGGERSAESRFGVVICYEDSDPGMSRPYAGADGEPPVDFLLNISNDGWFDGSSEHDQHLAICRFRAIECRRSIARVGEHGYLGGHRQQRPGVSPGMDTEGECQPLGNPATASRSSPFRVERVQESIRGVVGCHPD